MRLLYFTVAIITPLAVAQSASKDENPTSTDPAATTHTVSVGKDGPRFSPDTVEANPGDVVQFDFCPTNHSVARAGFSYPCIPYEFAPVGGEGFWSGFHPSPPSLPPTYNVSVVDVEPMFFYWQNDTFTLAKQRASIDAAEQRALSPALLARRRLDLQNLEYKVYLPTKMDVIGYVFMVGRRQDYSEYAQ
ncbi:hypothetical protein F4809DRAFT_638578 [Biscogniauxia mediterranea]|nr:hypothetical protein F4809DRAFT_638578 [Biscogniauxia mediterranea]